MANEKRMIDPNMKIIDKHFKKRLIDASAACERCRMKSAGNCGYCIIGTAPTVDATEVVHGRWLSLYEYAEKIGADATKSEYPGAWVFCSKCGQQMRNINGWHYCPNCGAKMDGGEYNERTD